MSGPRVFEAEVAFSADTAPVLRAMTGLGPMLTTRLGAIGTAAGAAFSSAFTMAATAGLAALAGGGALAAILGKSAVDAAVSQERAQAKLAAVLRSTGGAAGLTAAQINDLASEMQATTTVADDVALNAAAVLATFKEIKGDAFRDAMLAAADMSEVLDTDLKSSVMQIGKALNDPVKGLAALGRAGVSFTESQKAQIKALQESGDILGAQKIILAELQSEFGGAARAAAGTFAGQWAHLNNRIGEVLETIGFALIPSLRELQRPLASIVAWLEKNIGVVREWGDVAGEITRNVVDQVLMLAEAFGTKFVDGVNAAAAAVTGANFGESVTMILQQVEILTRDFDKTWELLKAGATLAATTVAKAFVDALRFVNDALGAGFASLPRIVQNAAGAIMDGLSAVGNFIRDMLANVSRGFDALFDHIEARIGRLAGIGGPAFAALFGGIGAAGGEAPRGADQVLGAMGALNPKGRIDVRGMVAGIGPALGALSGKLAAAQAAAAARAAAALGGMTPRPRDKPELWEPYDDKGKVKPRDKPKPGFDPIGALFGAKDAIAKGAKGLLGGAGAGIAGAAAVAVPAADAAVKAVGDGIIALAANAPDPQPAKFSGIVEFGRKIQETLGTKKKENKEEKRGEKMVEALVDLLKEIKERLTPAAKATAEGVGKLNLGFEE
ncbi:MAG: phage tail length tape measure family protein [Pirellulaceae bacterium]|nr:phage tail length tape measure family protein [Pirellulaceae bacterium]